MAIKRISILTHGATNIFPTDEYRCDGQPNEFDAKLGHAVARRCQTKRAGSGSERSDEQKGRLLCPFILDSGIDATFEKA